MQTPETPCLAVAALRLEKNLYKLRPSYLISPAEVELIIYLISVLIPLITSCVGGKTEEEKERRAYRYLTVRHPFIDWFTGKDHHIREVVADKWVEIGGYYDLADDVGKSVADASRSIDREYFHNLWKEARKANEQRQEVCWQHWQSRRNENRTDFGG
jgi:hypothetical protein